MAEYRGRLPLFHVDLYRLADAAEALAGGLIDDRQADGSRSWNGPNGWPTRFRRSDWTSSSTAPATIRGASSSDRGTRHTPDTSRRSRRPPRRGRPLPEPRPEPRPRPSDDGGTAPGHRHFGHERARGPGRCRRHSPDRAAVVAGYRHGEELLTGSTRYLRTPASHSRSCVGSSWEPAPAPHRLRVGLATAKATRSRTRDSHPGVPSQRLFSRRQAGQRSSRARRPFSCCRPDLRQSRRLRRKRVAGTRRRRAPDRPGATVVAVDLPGRAPAAAIAPRRGGGGRFGCGARSSRRRTARSGGDDVALLVPETFHCRAGSRR